MNGMTISKKEFEQLEEGDKVMYNGLEFMVTSKLKYGLYIQRPKSYTMYFPLSELEKIDEIYVI